MSTKIRTIKPETVVKWHWHSRDGMVFFAKTTPKGRLTFIVDRITGLWGRFNQPTNRAGLGGDLVNVVVREPWIYFSIGTRRYKTPLYV